MNAPASSRREERTATVYVPRRRLGALEAAAAMAVIVACMVALASMTGLLPHSARDDADATAGMSVAPAVNGVAAHAGGNSVMPAGAVMPATAAVPAQPAPVATITAASTAVAAPAEAPQAAGAAVTVPASAVTPALALQPTLPVAAVGNAPGKRHRRHDRSLHDANARYTASLDANRAQNRTGKTREQVIAELMQSKRDGTYPAQSETYR